MLLWVIGTLCAFGCLILGAFAYDARRYRTEHRDLPELPHARMGTCQMCLHWDHRAGLEVMQKHGAFWAAAQAITPNESMRSGVDSAGQRNAGKKRLPIAENRWNYMGACLGHEELRHRTDTCESYKLRVVGRFLPLIPGEGFTHAEPEPPANKPRPPALLWDALCKVMERPPELETICNWTLEQKLEATRWVQTVEHEIGALGARGQIPAYPAFFLIPGAHEKPDVVVVDVGVDGGVAP